MPQNATKVYRINEGHLEQVRFRLRANLNVIANAIPILRRGHRPQRHTNNPDLVPYNLIRLDLDSIGDLRGYVTDKLEHAIVHAHRAVALLDETHHVIGEERDRLIDRATVELEHARNLEADLDDVLTSSRFGYKTGGGA